MCNSFKKIPKEALVFLTLNASSEEYNSKTKQTTQTQLTASYDSI